MLRFIKQILIAFFVFGLIIFLISLLLPSRVQVSKSVLVNAPKDSIITTLLRIEDWKKWSPFLQDSAIQYNIVSGSKVNWQAADGTVHSIELDQYNSDSILAVIRAGDKIVFNSGFTVKTSVDNDHITKVEWWMMEELKWYPWEKFYGLFSESFKETYIENSLEMFRRYAESHFAIAAGTPE
ncbi:MAG: hypothetical protein KF746_21735 [Chitinophagaceae bacterium]|nr:hypothetical protein [Chitinophagaceae bacterium]